MIQDFGETSRFCCETAGPGWPGCVQSAQCEQPRPWVGTIGLLAQMYTQEKAPSVMTHPPPQPRHGTTTSINCTEVIRHGPTIIVIIICNYSIFHLYFGLQSIIYAHFSVMIIAYFYTISFCIPAPCMKDLEGCCEVPSG